MRFNYVLVIQYSIIGLTVNTIGRGLCDHLEEKRSSTFNQCNFCMLTLIVNLKMKTPQLMCQLLI